MPRFRSIFMVLAVFALLPASAAFAGISRILAHGDSFSSDDTIPVFVDTTRNSIIVKGQYMDLCTAVESNDSSFVVNIGTRTGGSNSSVEILVAANSAPDLDAATITIRFVSGQETFRVKAFKTNISRMEIMNRTTTTTVTCRSGETMTLRIDGFGMDHMTLGPVARMMSIADSAEGGPHYSLGEYFAGTTSARLPIHCRNPGTFNIVREWFWDPRIRQFTNSPMKVIRGSAPTKIRVTVTEP